MQVATRVQRAHFLDEACGQHRVEALLDTSVQRITSERQEREPRQLQWSRRGFFLQIGNVSAP